MAQKTSETNEPHELQCMLPASEVHTTALPASKTSNYRTALVVAFVWAAAVIDVALYVLLFWKCTTGKTEEDDTPFISLTQCTETGRGYSTSVFTTAVTVTAFVSWACLTVPVLQIDQKQNEADWGCLRRAYYWIYLVNVAFLFMALLLLALFTDDTHSFVHITATSITIGFNTFAWITLFIWQRVKWLSMRMSSFFFVCVGLTTGVAISFAFVLKEQLRDLHPSAFASAELSALLLSVLASVGFWHGQRHVNGHWHIGGDLHPSTRGYVKDDTPHANCTSRYPMLPNDQ